MTSSNSDPTLINFIFLSGPLINFNKLLENKLLGKMPGTIFTQKLKKDNMKLKTMRKKKQGSNKNSKF